MSAGNVLVAVDSLVKTFDEGEAAVTVLKGLDLTIERGELVALLGPSGSGKSTLLTILGTLMRPTSGRLSILDVNLVTAPDAELTEFRNRHLGFVFQFHHLLPDFTALENTIFPAAVHRGRETEEDRQRGRALLDRVGLADRRDYLSTKLSGGQKQRVAIARLVRIACLGRCRAICSSDSGRLRWLGCGKGLSASMTQTSRPETALREASGMPLRSQE